MTLYDHVKNIVLILLLFYFGPMIIEGIHTQYIPFITHGTQIGVITLSNGPKNSEFYTKTLNTFFENPRIKAILVVIDDCILPLGTAYAIFNEIVQLKKEHHKPLVALIENRCNAECYLIACASDHIIASEIGFIECKPNSIILENNKDESAYHDAYQHYIRLIATARKLSLATQAQWAQPLITGHQARITGLIDETGSLYNAILFFKQKTLILGSIEWIEKKQKKEILDYLPHVFFGNNHTVSQ